jgi:hypothetical protein
VNWKPSGLAAEYIDALDSFPGSEVEARGVYIFNKEARCSCHGSPAVIFGLIAQVTPARKPHIIYGIVVYKAHSRRADSGGLDYDSPRWCAVYLCYSLDLDFG